MGTVSGSTLNEAMRLQKKKIINYLLSIIKRKIETEFSSIACALATDLLSLSHLPNVVRLALEQYENSASSLAARLSLRHAYYFGSNPLREIVGQLHLGASEMATLSVAQHFLQSLRKLLHSASAHIVQIIDGTKACARCRLHRRCWHRYRWRCHLQHIGHVGSRAATIDAVEHIKTGRHCW